jgi:hypothetical protein
MSNKLKNHCPLDVSVRLSASGPNLRHEFTLSTVLQFSKANEQRWDTSEGEFIDGSFLHAEGI